MILSKFYLNNVLSKSSLGVFFITMSLRYIFGINKKVNFPINYCNKIAGSKRLVIKNGSPNLYKCLLVNQGITISTASNGIYIDSSTFIAPGVKIFAANHDLYNLELLGVDSPPIVIKENCWLGANVVILPGVELGPRTIVGAGSIVTKSFSGGSVVLAGNPAKIIKNL